MGRWAHRAYSASWFLSARSSRSPTTRCRGSHPSPASRQQSRPSSCTKSVAHVDPALGWTRDHGDSNYVARLAASPSSTRTVTSWSSTDVVGAFRAEGQHPGARIVSEIPAVRRIFSRWGGYRDDAEAVVCPRADQHAPIQERTGELLVIEESPTGG